jgi:hypothetical protein
VTKTQLALGTATVVLMISLVVNGFYFSANTDAHAQMSELRSQALALQTRVANLTSEKAVLQNQMAQQLADNTSQILQLQIQTGILQGQLADAENQSTQLQLQTDALRNQLTGDAVQIAVLENHATALQSDIISLQNQLANNATQIEQLKVTLAKTQNLLEYFQNRTLVLYPFEKEALQAALYNDSLNTPFLITRLGVKDVNDSSGTRLFIQGNVYNIGTATAYNCRLHVTIHLSNATVLNQDIKLSDLTIYSSTYVSQNIPYSGVQLDKWEIIPEFG